MADEVLVPRVFLEELQHAQRVEIVVRQHTGILAKAALIVGLGFFAWGGGWLVWKADIEPAWIAARAYVDQDFERRVEKLMWAYTYR